MSRWYGSLNNRLMENSKMPVPEVGMGVTECMWSDRHPYEIMKVIDDRHIVVRELDHKRIDNNGMSDVQDYEYTSNPDNIEKTLFRDIAGHWRERIGTHGLGESKFYIGRAEYYYDYSF